MYCKNSVCMYLYKNICEHMCVCMYLCLYASPLLVTLGIRPILASMLPPAAYWKSVRDDPPLLWIVGAVPAIEGRLTLECEPTILDRLPLRLSTVFMW